jgi:hypothetical protein
MTDEEMALEIAEFILSQQMREQSERSVLEKLKVQGRQLLELVQSGHEELLSEHAYRQRIDQLRNAFRAAKPDESLIRILHRELLFGYKVRP